MDNSSAGLQSVAAAQVGNNQGLSRKIFKGFSTFIYRNSANTPALRPISSASSSSRTSYGSLVGVPPDYRWNQSSYSLSLTHPTRQPWQEEQPIYDHEDGDIGLHHLPSYDPSVESSDRAEAKRQIRATLERMLQERYLRAQRIHSTSADRGGVDLGTQSARSEENSDTISIQRDYSLALRWQEQEEAQPQESQPERRNCSVCGDDTLIADLPTLAQCDHEPSTCVECYQHWISSELENKGWNGIKCPAIGCTVILEHNDVRSHAEQEVFLRYDAFSIRSFLNTEPNFQWCIAPGCQSGQIHGGGPDDPEFTCVSCRFKMCISHMAPWHKGETCRAYDIRVGRDETWKTRQKEERASERLVRQKTKTCPTADCGWKIEKTGGCDHMMCTKCRHEFCWVCLVDFNGPTGIRMVGKTAHHVTCRYRYFQRLH